jgi:hypothetical protein
MRTEIEKKKEDNHGLYLPWERKGGEKIETIVDENPTIRHCHMPYHMEEGMLPH